MALETHALVARGLKWLALQLFSAFAKMSRVTVTVTFIIVHVFCYGSGSSAVGTVTEFERWKTWKSLFDFQHYKQTIKGPGSDWLRAGRSGDQIQVGARFSASVQTGPGAHPGTGSFPRVKSGRGVTLTPQPFLVPWSRKSRAIPLLPLLAVRPVQSLSACTVQL